MEQLASSNPKGKTTVPDETRVDGVQRVMKESSLVIQTEFAPPNRRRENGGAIRMRAGISKTSGPKMVGV